MPSDFRPEHNHTYHMNTATYDRRDGSIYLPGHNNGAQSHIYLVVAQSVMWQVK